MTYGGDVEQLQELTDLLTALDSPGNHFTSVAALAGLSRQRFCHLLLGCLSGA